MNDVIRECSCGWCSKKGSITCDSCGEMLPRKRLQNTRRFRDRARPFAVRNRRLCLTRR